MYPLQKQNSGLLDTHTPNMTTFCGTKPGLCVKFSYKVQNYEFSKSRSTDGTSFSVKQERESATIYCSQEVEQGSSFQTTSFEWSWATKECGNFFICIYFSICFWHNQLQLGPGMWWAKVTPKWLWGESVQLLFVSTNTEGQAHYSESIIPP